jgi:predicted  nucleic acid-binding Zn-ribbon protein
MTVYFLLIFLAFSAFRLYNQNAMSRPFKLYRLQQIDSQLDRLRAHLKEVEDALLDDQDVRAAEQNFERIKDQLQQTRKSLRSAEYETQQQRIKMEQTEASLYGGKVRNPKELQDLQNESAALKRHLGVLEERQFEIMLEDEEISHRLETADQERSAVKQQHAERIQKLEQQKAKLLREFERSEEERQATTPSIDAQDLQFYTQLRQKKRGIAVAKVTDRACSACGSTLSATLLNATHSPNQLNQCETCGRILYIG